jgi:hypothetical protein
MAKTKATKNIKLKDPAMLFYPSDFMMEISYMTNEEAGKYIRVLCNIFFHGRLSIDIIKRICGEEYETILNLLSRDDKGLYYHERMEYEMLKRRQFCESRSKNASSKSKKEEDKAEETKTVGTGVPDCPQAEEKKAEEKKPEQKKVEETKSEEKKIYGREQNILLTDGEYCALKGELGDKLEKRIEDVSLYIKKFGKKYESHYALILSWRELDNGQAGRNNVAINGDYSDIAFLANSDMQLSAEQGGGFVRKMKNAGVKT